MLKITPKSEMIVGNIASGGYFVFAALSVPYIFSWIYNPEYRHLFAPNIYSYLMLITNLFLDIIWSTSLMYISSQRSFEKHIESEKRLKSLFNNSHDGIVMLNKDGIIVDFNSAYSNMLGYRREELLNVDFYKITPEKWREWERQAVIEKLAADNTFTITYEKEFFHKSNEIFPIELSAFAAKDIDGEPHYWGIVKDITERKKNERIIKARLELNEFSFTHSLNDVLQKTLDLICELTNSPIGFYHFVDENQENISLQAWSTNTIKNYCHTKPEMTHYSVDKAGVWAECVKTKKPVIHNDYKALENKKGLPEGHAEVIRELVVPVLRNGKVVSILGIGNKKSLYDQNDVDFVSFFADVAYSIVERKRHEQQIENQNTKLTELNATKDKFISILAHDLRNPFTLLITLTEILVDNIEENKYDTAIKDVKILRDTSRNTYQLLENLLQWAYSQQNRISFYPQRLGLTSTVNDCIKMVKGNAMAKKIDISIDIAESHCVYADNEMVKTVIRNLLSNAIKYTPATGQIHISSNIINCMVEVTISDTGVGMDEKTQNTLFKIGLTKSAKGTEGEHGTGFGLILCKEFIEKQGGNIWAESEPGKGSHFKFTLPVYVAESESKS
jgi:PAS domain S-box-containing protein